MKKAILMAMGLIAACAVPIAHAEEPLNVLLTGGSEANSIRITLSVDGRTYTIDSIHVLAVGGSVCANPEGNPNKLICEAAAISGFEVNAGGGDDSVIVGRDVPVPVTLRGGPGGDKLLGGARSDKLVGGPGDDLLIGRGGNDWIFGGPGEDRLIGCGGDDELRGGEGKDVLISGSGGGLLPRR
jgi:Ca2+-binding RTX toxin-like protein